MPSETEQAFEQILSHEVTFRIHWNNIEGATSPAWWELPHQCITSKVCYVSQANLLVVHQTIHGEILGRPGDLWIAFGDWVTVLICAALPGWSWYYKSVSANRTVNRLFKTNVNCGGMYQWPILPLYGW